MLDRNGIVVLSAFATIWLLFAKLNNAPISWLMIAFGACISASLVWWTFRLRTASPALSTADQARIGRIFTWSSIAEGVGIFLIVNILANIGQADRFMAGIALVVGLHFVPPALLIPRRSYLVIGSAMVATSIAGFLIPSARTAAFVVGSLGALTLWTTVGMAVFGQKARAPLE